MNSWLVSSKPSYFDALGAFEKYELIDWGNGANNKIEVGDIVYIYISDTLKEIKIKTEVIKVNLKASELLESDADNEFYMAGEENRLKPDLDNYFRLKKIKIFDDEVSKKLSLEILRKYGLTNTQSKTRIKDDLLIYIHKIENEKLENLDNMLNIKNIILYGAPGVGKTHNYKNLISMIEENKPQKKIFDTIAENRHVELENKTFESIKQEKRVEFVTFHQSYSYEDFIEGFRPNESGNIELEDGIFKTISDKALINILDSQKNKNQIENEYTYANLFDEFKLYIEDKLSADELFYLKGKATITNIGKSSFLVGGSVSSGQNLAFSIIERDYENFKKGNIQSYKDIKSTFESKSGIHENAPYYFALYQKLKEFEDKCFDNSHKIELDMIEQKNFYIVIDEINRGNISKIFGELITLIEEDKRDVYEVTLPYSKEKFKVPSNLYIIATMNSTDKSIATIDIALRRRFTFIKMQPNKERIKFPHAKELFNKLNEFIENNLNEDYKLGHSYFMNITNDEDLAFVKEYKIKPLLEEYFYVDKTKLDEALSILDGNLPDISDN